MSLNDRKELYVFSPSVCYSFSWYVFLFQEYRIHTLWIFAPGARNILHETEFICRECGLVQQRDRKSFHSGLSKDSETNRL